MELPVPVLLVLVYLLVIAMNVVPAFMPATWTVLTFFRLVYQLPLLPLSLGGAISATLGRFLLARLSAAFGERFLTPGQREKMARLGRYLEEKRELTLATILLFAFGPIPSNQLFIAAGLTGTDLRLVLPPFLLGRLVSYTVLVYLTTQATTTLAELFARSFRGPMNVAVQILGLALLALLTVLDWPALLSRWTGWQPPWQRTQTEGPSR